MGFLSWLGLRPPTQIESPWADPDVLTRVTWSELFPEADPDAWPLTRAEALTVPAVAAVRHRIVGTLSRLPLVATKAGREWTDAVSLLRQPDDGEPHPATMARTLDDLLFDGGAWWLVVSAYNDATGTAGRPRPASVVTVPLDHIAEHDGVYAPSPAFLTWLDKARGLVPLADPAAPARPWLIYFTGPHPGLLFLGRVSIRTGARIERAAGRAADNPVPAVELHQTTDSPLERADIDRLINEWSAARRGKNGGVAYTNKAIEAKMHGAADAQLLVDGRNQSAVDVARLAGVPAATIDAGIPGASLTYANLNDRVTDLVNMGLSPYAAAITSRLSMDDVTPHGVSVAFDYSTLYPATTEAAPSAANRQESNA